MTHLYLIRHADYIYDLVDGEYPKRDQGLSADGHQQAEKLRAYLAKTGDIQPDIFISSPERGARETAEILASLFEVPLQFDDDVKEWVSEDGTLSTEEFMEPWNTLSASQKPYYRWVEGCETMLEFSLRVHVTLNRILQAHTDKTILILTHGAFIQASFAYFFGYSSAVQQRGIIEINRTSITEWVSLKDERWLLKRVNDCHHLQAWD